MRTAVPSTRATYHWISQNTLPPNSFLVYFGTVWLASVQIKISPCTIFSSNFQSLHLPTGDKVRPHANPSKISSANKVKRTRARTLTHTHTRTSNRIHFGVFLCLFSFSSPNWNDVMYKQAISDICRKSYCFVLFFRRKRNIFVRHETQFIVFLTKCCRSGHWIKRERKREREDEPYGHAKCYGDRCSFLLFTNLPNESQNTIEAIAYLFT